MREVLFILALFGIVSTALMVGILIGHRRALRKRGIWDMRMTIQAFDNVGKAMQGLSYAIASSFAVPLRFWGDDATRRIPHEHPVDWVLRVGPQVSGHNITGGEAWRFRELRDWWTPDDIIDEYGYYYVQSPHAWGSEVAE